MERDYVDEILGNLNVTIGNGFRKAERRLRRLHEGDLMKIARITGAYKEVFRGNTADEARSIANRFIQYLQTRTKCGQEISDVDLEIECFQPEPTVVVEKRRYHVD